MLKAASKSISSQLGSIVSDNEAAAAVEEPQTTAEEEDLPELDDSEVPPLE